MLTRELIGRLSYDHIQGDLDREVTGICFDNRKVEAGNAFVCIKGVFFDTHSVIDQIDAAGAALIIVDKSRVSELSLDGLQAAVIAVEDPRAAKAGIAAAWYGYPSEKITVIGVTGSKGKTTTTSMIAATIRAAGHSVGTIGSNGVRMNDEVHEVANTTPDSDEMQRWLSVMVDKGIEYAILECSSQGLMQHRTDQIQFALGVFVNIQHGDHVGTDEHPTFENYVYCKGLLLKQCDKAIINMDDEFIDQILEGVTAPLVSFGHDGVHKATDKLGSTPDYIITEEHPEKVGDLIGEAFHLTGAVEDDVVVAMPGSFIALNGSAVVAAAHELGIPMEAVKKALREIHINGRMDMIFQSEDLSVCIDSAHTRQSTKAVLTALRTYNPKRLVCVFGAGGNRDIERRIGMGESAGKYADFTIVTTEHNRFEPFSQILEGVKQGIEPTGGQYIVIEDRNEAIHYSITHSQPGDMVAIIGLGDDKYMHCMGKNIPQDDDKSARAAIEEWKAARAQK